MLKEGIKEFKYLFLRIYKYLLRFIGIKIILLIDNDSLSYTWQFVFSSRDVTTVLYILIVFAYCFPSIEKSFPINREITTTSQGDRAHVRDHVFSLT